MDNETTVGQVTETTSAVDPTTATTETKPESVASETAATKYSKYYSDDTKADDPVATGLSTLQKEISELKSALASQGANSSTTAAVDQTFLGLLKEGKDREAEEYLINKAAAKAATERDQLKSDFEKRITEMEQNIQQRTQMDTQINEFVSNLKSQNPELTEFEDIITLRAQSRLQGAINSGRVKTQQDILEAFKEAVLLEVDSAKKLVQRLRGAGKTEALTTKQTILSSSPARPNGVTSHGDNIPQGERKPMTTADYIAARRERQETNRRLVSAS